MKTTFLNNNSEGDLRKIGLKSLKSAAEDFRGFMNAKTDEEYEEFYDYGLGYDGVENEKTGDVEYYRYQLSWGGPSSEVRFHPNGLIEYVYMDWYCGVGFDVTEEDWAQWLFQHFQDCDYMTWIPSER